MGKDILAAGIWRDAALDPPMQNGCYIVCIRPHCTGRYYANIANYSSDLYSVDEYDFCDKKGVAGWYTYDDEYGYIEQDVDYWMEIPELPELKERVVA